MVEVHISTTNVIRETRQSKQTAHISLAEMQFVVSEANLNTIDKLLWLLIAAHANGSNLTSMFSCVSLSSMVNLTCQEVYQALSRLARLGFLEIEGFCVNKNLDFYLPWIITLRLPLEGLLALKRAPNAIKEECESRLSVSVGGRRGEVLINLLKKNVQEKIPRSSFPLR